MNSESENEKLAALIDGAVRSISASERGREYMLVRKIGSMHHALCYIQEVRGESDDWLQRAESDVVDF